MRTDHGEKNLGSGPWEILYKWLGWWAPTTAGGRQAEHLQMGGSQYKGGYVIQSTVQHSARTQQISTEHHHCLMRLKRIKILFWAVSHKTILLLQPLISLSPLKLDIWDPNQQNILNICMEFRQSFRCKIYVLFSLSLRPLQSTYHVKISKCLRRQWKNSEKIHYFGSIQRPDSFELLSTKSLHSFFLLTLNILDSFIMIIMIIS